MELVHTIIFYGVLTSLSLMALILISLYIQPRIWMQDLPEEVRRSMPPKTTKEKKQALVVMMVFLAFLIILPAIAVATHVSQLTFLEAWFITYSIDFIFNLTDLLLIDWLIVCTITPVFLRVNGVDERVYKNYSKHLKDFIKGMAIIALPSLISCVIGYCLTKYDLF